MFLLRGVSFIIGIILACVQFWVIDYIRSKGKGLWAISLITLAFLFVVIIIAVVFIKIDIIMALCLPGAFALILNIYAVIKFYKLKTGGN